ncbi:MAG: AMP-binding protein, partial [Candidatus Cloacimonadota bacterium]|nr:AMP-binding protein [Candidatus Cloacimonadota bacterium]
MTLQERFAKMAKKFPKKVAIIDQATNKEFTYEKALISSIIFANKIKKYPEKNIGVMVPTSAGAMLTFIAVLMAGKTPVMINYSTGAIKNCKYAAERCNFKTILTSKKLLDKLNLEPIDGMYFLEDIVKDITLFDKISGLIKSKLNIFYKGDKEELAVVLFTSGSEKDPKGVMLTHKNIISNIDAILKTYPQITHEDTFLSSLPLFHVFGLTVTFWYPLLIGASMLSYPNPLEYSTISKLVKKYKLGIMVSTPSFLYGYLRKSNAGDFSSLKLCIAGADKVTSHLFESFKKKHGIEIMEGYGTTELSPVVSVNTPENFRLGSIGQPLPGVQVKILHIDTDKELGTNEIGKIFVKGDNLMKGY